MSERTETVEDAGPNPCPPVPRALPLLRRLLLGGLSLLIASAIWLPFVHLLFRPADGTFRSRSTVSPTARALAARHGDLWPDTGAAGAEIDAMRVTNPEWDFMGRTFLVLSLANMSLHEPVERDAHLRLIDRIIDDTEQAVNQEGKGYFMLGYANRSSFRQQPVRSIFIDGEVLMMMAARRLVAEHEPYRRRMDELAVITEERMRSSPVLSCESYPNECWTFCNTVALAALRMHEVLDRVDHAALLDDWVAVSKERLVDPTTGLLCSSFTYDGTMLDGPEGSSIWMAAHCLQIVDPAFAQDQYDRARAELSHRVLGFGWAGEWPASWVGPMDVDSGPVIPLLDVSAGASGMAFIAAAGFDDDDYYRSLATTIRFAGFPLERHGRMQFCAGNQVGDAVLLYSTVSGPLWKRVMELHAQGASR